MIPNFKITVVVPFFDIFGEIYVLKSLFVLSSPN